MRKNSFHPEEISYEGHQRWFAKQIEEEGNFLYLFHDSSGALAGQVRFNPITAGEYQISISLAEQFRGKKLSATFLKQALEAFPQAGVIVAWIKPENRPSLKAFIRAGFEEQCEEQVCGVPSIRMEVRC